MQEYLSLLRYCKGATNLITYDLSHTKSRQLNLVKQSSSLPPYLPIGVRIIGDNLDFGGHYLASSAYLQRIAYLMYVYFGYTIIFLNMFASLLCP